MTPLSRNIYSSKKNGKPSKIFAKMTLSSSRDRINDVNKLDYLTKMKQWIYDKTKLKIKNLQKTRQCPESKV